MLPRSVEINFRPLNIQKFLPPSRSQDDLKKQVKARGLLRYGCSSYTRDRSNVQREA